jgi:hypothetical protein
MLPLANEDMAYLNMDKVSFLVKIDFDRIPRLKNMLIESGIWKAKEALDSTTIEATKNFSGIDENKTMFVKKYFDKIVGA